MVAPLRTRREDAGLQPEGVEERVDDQVAVAFPQPDHRRPRVVRADGRLVAQHRALGHAGGAGGEQDVAQVVGPDRGGPGRDIGPVDLAGPFEEVGPRRRAVARGAPQHDDLVERGGFAGGAQQGDVVGVEEVGDREEDAGSRGAQDVGGFVALEPGVERHDHRARPVHRAGGHDPLVDVRRPDRDPVTRLDAGGDQRGGGLVDPCEEVAEAPAHLAIVAAVDQPLTITEERRGPLERAGDGGGQVGGGRWFVAGDGHGGLSTLCFTGRSWATASGRRESSSPSPACSTLACRPTPTPSTSMSAAPS